MTNGSIGFRAFMDGFTQGGLFGWAKMPGGADRIFEETTNLEESEFADLLRPLADLLCPLDCIMSTEDLEREDEDLADYALGFRARLNKVPLDITQTAAWRKGWAAADVCES